MKLTTLAISHSAHTENGLTYRIAPGAVDLSPAALAEVGVYNEETGELLGCFSDGTARLSEGRKGISLELDLHKNDPAHRAAVELAGEDAAGLRVDYEEAATEKQRVGGSVVYTQLKIAQIVLTADRPDTTKLSFILDHATNRAC
ncbi:MAG: hypothetical protein K8R46_10895 [Pirellulales bacterium]|nr:hypothetical protein [Pirellulales bacterium]